MTSVRDKVHAKAYDAVYPGAKAMRDPETRKAYHAEQAMLHRQFQSDLEADCGIPSDHPKADLLFRLAWDRGHDHGLMDVVYYYEEMSELLV